MKIPRQMLQKTTRISGYHLFLYSFLLLSFFFQNVEAQIYSSCPISITPANPTNKDFVTLSTHVTTPNNGKYLGYNVTQQGSVRKVSECYWWGMLTVINDFDETVPLGTFSPGQYKIEFSAYQSITQDYCCYDLLPVVFCTSTLDFVVRDACPQYFHSAWENQPATEQMTCIVTKADLDGINLEPGDEIAIFDGSTCAGMAKLTWQIDYQQPLTIILSKSTGVGDGFISGHSITIKFWDCSSNKVIDVNKATFFNLQNPLIPVPGYFQSGVNFLVELTARLIAPQTITLNAGWNIFSANVIPVEPDMKVIFQGLIDDGSLRKIQDETGKSLENLGIFGGWTNNIGNISPFKGYKVKVTRNCQLNLSGLPVELPLMIPLKSGWNIMGYPLNYEVDAKNAVWPLCEKGTLIKVQDDIGNALEDWGIFEPWRNNIGNFKPGEGYKIKVTTSETLTFP